MKQKLGYLLVLIVLGSLFLANVQYLPKLVFVIGLSVIALFFSVRSLISLNKKIVFAELSGLQKISTILVYSCLFGCITAVVFILCRLRHIGMPLLNFSLGLYIAGAVAGIFAPAKQSVDGLVLNAGKRSFAVRAFLYLCTICSVSGLLLKINHHPVGKLFMYGGFALMCIFLVAVIMFRKRIARQ